MSKILCIYHGNCADGFGAAWVIRKCFGEENVEFIAGVYQKSPPDCAGRDVIIVDFSYKRAGMEKIIAEANSLTWLDHHKSAIEESGSLMETHPIQGNLDMEHSGAMLAWRYFFPDQEPPQLLYHIEDRDIHWPHLLDGTKEIQSCVFSYPYDFVIWDGLMATDVGALRAEGEALARKHMKDINEFLTIGKRRMFILGHNVPVASLPYFQVSEAGHIMAKGEPFAACYWDVPDGRIFGLRSTDEGLDVSEIAKRYGGGGHRNSAGFKIQYAQADHHIAYPIKVFEYQDLTTCETRWFAGMRAQDVGLFMDWDRPKSNARELTEAELDEYKIVHATGKEVTYRERLMELIATPDIKFPQPFAEPLP